MSFASPNQIEASSAKTVSGQTGTIPISDLGSKLNILIDCTAASGTTPTLDLRIEWSMTSGAAFAAADVADSFVQITTAKKTVKQFDVKAPHYRVVWTIAGATPSFTFSVREFISP